MLRVWEGRRCTTLPASFSASPATNLAPELMHRSDAANRPPPAPKMLLALLLLTRAAETTPLQGCVKAAAHLVESLARRVGPVAVGGPVPRAILQQKWSPINVPLIWGAAGTDETTPVFDWLMGEASRVPDQVQFHDGHTDVCNAVREGWHALREVMRTWGIENRCDLSDWLGRRGFPRTSAGNHISARVQEVILSEASAIDARVALVEAACVAITLCRGRAGAVRVPEVVPPVPRRTRQTEITAESWVVDLSEVFLERIPMLKTCPRFLRGRLRFSFAIALRERHRAKLEGDMVGANRAWKLFV